VSSPAAAFAFEPGRSTHRFGARDQMPSHAGPLDLGRWPASFDYHYSLEQAPVHNRWTFGAHSSKAILPPDNQSCQPGLIPGCAVSPEPGASAKKEIGARLALAATAPWWIPDRFALCMLIGMSSQDTFRGGAFEGRNPLLRDRECFSFLFRWTGIRLRILM